MKTPKIEMLQNVREAHYLPNRSAMPKPDGLYLLRLRTSRLATQLPPARYTIPVMVKDAQKNHAQVVKITHR
jgi:hypothetical protein